MARAIAVTDVAEAGGTSYPAPFRAAVAGRTFRRLGDAFGLTQFGVNLVRLAPGAASALRHAHSAEDEFVLVTEGTPTLITHDGEQALAPGMVAGFPAGTGDAHHLVNRTEADVVFLVVGTKAHERDVVTYPDDDLRVEPSPGGRRFVKADGSPW
ncbi:cupin domain-containing protein [Elioraea sp.]|uniref:cupin domain-containing protein n=1 Tax=Elioraea sp. TaxID=2185103 RepID=UPI0025B9A422|nr:cupin domain-containing protein [Elioraea sp.]